MALLGPMVPHHRLPKLQRQRLDVLAHLAGYIVVVSQPWVVRRNPVFSQRDDDIADTLGPVLLSFHACLHAARYNDNKVFPPNTLGVNGGWFQRTLAKSRNCLDSDVRGVDKHSQAVGYPQRHSQYVEAAALHTGDLTFPVHAHDNEFIPRDFMPT